MYDRWVSSLFQNEDIKAYLWYAARHPFQCIRLPENKRREYWRELVHSHGNVRKLASGKAIPPLLLADFEREKEVYACGNLKNVRLAGKTIEVSLENIDWSLTFDDAEDVAAYHRFMWLYRYVMDTISISERKKLLAATIKLIHGWIDEVETIDRRQLHDEVWQTYSVSERIVNWMLMIGVLIEEPFRDEKIIESIIRQADYIQYHLEYYGELLTGNHLTNDAKGLYVSGALLNINDFRNLGRTLIKQEYERVVFKPGFLREGSSHYQILYTKWFFELYQIAEQTGDKSFAKWIEPRLRKLSTCADIFLYKNTDEKWDMQFFGDISPDYPPKWILGIPNAVDYYLENEEQKSSLKNEEWARLDKDDYIIHARVFSHLYPNNAPGHFHRDTGSFTLVYRGQKVIVDAGRRDYSEGGMADYQKSRYGHNQLIINGKCAEIAMRRFYAPGYLEKAGGKKPEITCEDDTIEMKQAPGSRLKGVTDLKRRICVEDGTAVITDTVKGKGIHNIELALHIHPDFQITKTNGEISLKGNGLVAYVTYSSLQGNIICMTDDERYCNYSETYGEGRKCGVLLFRDRAALPYTLETRIKIGEL